MASFGTGTELAKVVSSVPVPEVTTKKERRKNNGKSLRSQKY